MDINYKDPFYNYDLESMSSKCDVDIEKGLSSAEAQKRLEHYGPNELT